MGSHKNYSGTGTPKCLKWHCCPLLGRVLVQVHVISTTIVHLLFIAQHIKMAATEIHSRRRRIALLTVVTCTAALSIQSIFTSKSIIRDYVTIEGDLDSTIIEGTEHEFHRMLYEMGDKDVSQQASDSEILAIPSEVHGNTIMHPAALKKAQEEEASSFISYAKLIDSNKSLPPYSIKDALQASNLYDNTFALLVYAPEDDAFYGLYSHKHTWVTGCLKLMNSLRDLTYLLRKIFPDRFRGAESEELGK